MADLNSKIDDIVQGDDVYITRDITNVPIGHQLTDVWFSIKEEHWDVDVVVTKHATAVASAEGHIPDTGTGDTVGIVQIILDKEDTKLLRPFYNYVFDLQVKTSNGSVTKLYTAEYGIISVYPNITENE